MEQEISKRIFDVAQAMFLDHGVRAVKMDDLSKELGISKKTLYENIENKGDLVFSTVKRELQYHQTKVKAILKKDYNAVSEMLMIGKTVVTSLTKFNLTVIHELERFYPDVWDLIKLNHSQFVPKVIQSNLQKGIKQGLYFDDLQIDIVSKLYTNQSHILMDKEIFPKEKYDAAEVFKTFFHHHMRGICTPKGIKKFDSELKK